MMDTVDYADAAMWMDLEAEGQLGSEESARLAKEIAAAEDRSADEARALAADRAAWANLHRALSTDRIEVRPDFEQRVMASVDLDAWRPQATPAWRLPLAMMLIFALGAAWSLSGVSADHPVMGTGAAIADFLQSTALAGAGVTVASWRGVGMGLEELFAASELNVVALGIMVLCLNLLFFSLLRRRPRAVAAGGESGRRADRQSSDS